MFLDQIELTAGERILARRRRHWFVQLTSILSPLLLAAIPLLVLWFAKSLTLPVVIPDLTPYLPYALFLYVLWLLFIWLSIFTIWTNHYLDVITITTERIILVDQKGFFRRVIASFRFERLQDIHVEIDGLLATLLDYGTLVAETAGHSNQEFRATGLPNPRHLKALILKAVDTSKPHTKGSAHTGM